MKEDLGEEWPGKNRDLLADILLRKWEQAYLGSLVGGWSEMLRAQLWKEQLQIALHEAASDPHEDARIAEVFFAKAIGKLQEV
jgi:hypothetical protein